MPDDRGAQINLGSMLNDATQADLLRFPDPFQGATKDQVQAMVEGEGRLSDHVRSLASALAESEARAKEAEQAFSDLAGAILIAKAEYRVNVDNGQGVWPGRDYIQDCQWNGWLGALVVLNRLATEAERLSRGSTAAALSAKCSDMMPATGRPPCRD
jgi:hypothetical protein